MMTPNQDKTRSVRIAGLGFCLGAASLYFLDSRSGKRRRSLLRDQVFHFARAGVRRVKYWLRGAEHEMVGFFSNFRGQLQSEEVDDSVLLARIHSRLGHEIRDRGGLILEIHDGRVILRGEVPSALHTRIFRSVQGVRGVKHVESDLGQPHRHRGGASVAA